MVLETGHVGIVESVSSSDITVIEGNKNDAVGRRTLQVGGKYIRGYGVPKYAIDSSETPVSSKTVDELAQEVLAGNWGNGEERKNRLSAAGYDYDSVQTKVNELCGVHNEPHPVYYTVKSGDTLSAIAHQYGTTVSAIQSMQVQEELIRRRIVHTSPNGKTRTFSSNHVFAQIIICGKCGEVFRRVHWNNRGKKSVVWRCVSRLENTGLFCDARTVPESTIEQVLVTAINQTLCDKDSFLTTLRDNIATVINRKSNRALADIDKRLEELQTELLKLATSNADYDKVGDEIYRLRDQKQKLQVENANRDELKKRMADMSTFLKKQSTALTEYNEQLVRRLIEKVTIYEDKFTVEFKSGVTVDVE